MFSLFKPKTDTPGQKATFKLSGLHCTSCSLNIDGALEETKGVLSSSTSYAKSQTTISYDPSLITKDALVKVITDQGYAVVA